MVIIAKISQIPNDTSDSIMPVFPTELSSTFTVTDIEMNKRRKKNIFFMWCQFFKNLSKLSYGHFNSRCFMEAWF